MKWLAGILSFVIVPMCFAASVRLERNGLLRSSDAPGNAIVCLDGTNALPSSPTNFYQPAALKVSKVRQVTLDREGNILITGHDAGYVRRIRFLPR